MYKRKKKKQHNGCDEEARGCGYVARPQSVRCSHIPHNAMHRIRYIHSLTERRCIWIIHEAMHTHTAHVGLQQNDTGQEGAPSNSRRWTEKKQKRKGPTKFGGTWKAVNYIWTRSLLCAWIMYASFSRISRHRSCCIYICVCVPQVCIVACSAPPARGGVGESSAKDIWRQRQSWAPASLPIPIRIEFRGTKAIKAALPFFHNAQRNSNKKKTHFPIIVARKKKKENKVEHGALPKKTAHTQNSSAHVIKQQKSTPHFVELFQWQIFFPPSY